MGSEITPASCLTHSSTSESRNRRSRPTLCAGILGDCPCYNYTYYCKLRSLDSTRSGRLSRSKSQLPRSDSGKSRFAFGMSKDFLYGFVKLESANLTSLTPQIQRGSAFALRLTVQSVGVCERSSPSFTTTSQPQVQEPHSSWEPEVKPPLVRVYEGGGLSGADS